jgi:hypothetical protein
MGRWAGRCAHHVPTHEAPTAVLAQPAHVTPAMAGGVFLHTVRKQNSTSRTAVTGSQHAHTSEPHSTHASRRCLSTILVAAACATALMQVMAARN